MVKRCKINVNVLGMTDICTYQTDCLAEKGVAETEVVDHSVVSEDLIKSYGTIDIG